jgi:hypothetical protein
MIQLIFFQSGKVGKPSIYSLFPSMSASDLPLLGYILQRAIEEHPASHDLQVLINWYYVSYLASGQVQANFLSFFLIGLLLYWQILNLIFLRFVFQDKTSANWQEKITKMVNADQPLDLKYTLYAGLPNIIFNIYLEFSPFFFLCS